MVADKSFGHTFHDVLDANDAQVLYFEWFGGPPDGKPHVVFTILIDPGGNH